MRSFLSRFVFGLMRMILIDFNDMVSKYLICVFWWLRDDDENI